MKPAAPLFTVSPRVPTLCALLSGLVALGLPALRAADPAAEAPKTEEKAKDTAAADTKASEAPPADPAAEPTPGEFRNWFNVSVGGLVVDGDKAAAQRRLGLPASAFGGVEEFHFEKDVGKKGLFKIDGRGIFDNEDYGVRLEYSNPEKGFVRGGLRQSREYSDGSGGWFPGNNQWFDLYDNQLELVRGSAFFEAGLRLPNIPEVTVKYSHDYREGSKDSTIWGDTALTGGAGVRSIVPSFWNIDEKTDAISLDIRHTLGIFTFGGGFSYEHGDLDNSLNLRRRPGEAADRHVTQTERVERDVYSARAFVESIFNEKVRLTTSYLYTTLDTDLGGSRVAGAGYDSVYDPVYGRRDAGFLNLIGGSQLDQHVWNLNLMWTPLANVAIIPAVRLENQTIDGASSWSDAGADIVAREAAQSRDLVDLTEQLEIRYTGITNVVLYARGDWGQGDGNLLERQVVTATRQTELARDTDFDRFSQKYTVGAHWYPLRRVNLHAQYYRKIRENTYDTQPADYVNLNPLYPAYLRSHDFVTDDVNFRVTWRPIDKLTLISRYDYQENTVDVSTRDLDSQRAARSQAHIFGETITWTPVNRLYLQPGINYVIDTTESGASSAATVENSDNNYVNVTCTVGVVMDDRTDLQVQYNYYLADNFNPDLALDSQPYGAGTAEHGVLASIIRRISPRLRATLRYGFFNSRSEMAGGFNDYDAHLVYSSIQYLF